MFYVNLLLFKAKIIKVIRKFYQLLYVQRQGKNPYVRNSVIFCINVKTTLKFWSLLHPSSSHVRRAYRQTDFYSGRLLWGGGGPFSLGSQRVLQAVQEVPLNFITSETNKPAWLVH
jgi:hypothetical protein